MTGQKLYRPTKNRVLFGVCQGIGQYFNIDPVVVRVIFVILALWGGSGVFLYLIALFLMPDEKTLQTENEKNKAKAAQDRVESVVAEISETVEEKTKILHGEALLGLIVIIIGLMFLTQTFFPIFAPWRLWPLILIAIGIVILVKAVKKEK